MSIRLRFVLFLLFGVLIPLVPAVFFLFVGVVRFDTDVPLTTLLIGMGIFATLLAVVASALISVLRRFERPLEQFLHGIEQISEGNLSPDLPKEGPSEFRMMSQALETMCGQMKMVLSQLSTLSQHVVDTTSGAGASFQEVQDGVKTQGQISSRTFDAVGQMSGALGKASREIEAMASRIDKSATQVSQMDMAIRNVSESISGLNAIIEKASTTTRDGDKNVRIVARDISDLGSQVHTAQGALSDMMEGAQKARVDAETSSEILANLTTETERIGAAIEATLDGSDAVQRSNERILDVTASLESRVDRVDDVLEAIHSLAERTKLLSINASIIASEAGEHGRAFAVVAREVKELAQSTATAISEISVVLGGLKEGFAQTVQTIQRGREDVDRGVRLARDAVVLLHSIPEEVHRSAALSKEIVTRNSRQVEKGIQVEEIIIKVATALGQVSDILSEQVSRNDRTLALFNSISMTAEQVLKSTHDHAEASGSVSRTVEIISGDFRSLTGQVRDSISGLNDIVNLSQKVLTVTDSNRTRAAELSTLIADLNRYALYLGEDFRKLSADEN